MRETRVYQINREFEISDIFWNYLNEAKQLIFYCGSYVFFTISTAITFKNPSLV